MSNTNRINQIAADQSWSTGSRRMPGSSADGADAGRAGEPGVTEQAVAIDGRHEERGSRYRPGAPLRFCRRVRACVPARARVVLAPLHAA
jgi:hypothetical protein